MRSRGSSLPRADDAARRASAAALRRRNLGFAEIVDLRSHRLRRWRETRRRADVRGLDCQHRPSQQRLLEQLATDQHAPDFRGAGADLVELGVAQQPAGRVVVDVAVAAQRLDRLAAPSTSPSRRRRGWRRRHPCASSRRGRRPRPPHRHRRGRRCRPVYMSASLPCISWNSPIGWPNCRRSCT